MRTRILPVMMIACHLWLPAEQPAPGFAQSDCRLFIETGHTVCGKFLWYWDSHGALSQQGFPISEELQEKSDIDGRTYSVQYFERAVFELHPENAGTPYEILLSLLGSYQYRSLYARDAYPEQHASVLNPRFFPETGHTLGGIFRAYWEQHGGLEQQGFPISDEFQEVSAFDAKPYLVQYLERAVVEYHPENAGTPYEVLLSQLGTYRYRVKYGYLTIPSPLENGARQTAFVGSDTYLLWREVKGFWDANSRSVPSVKVVVLDLRTNRTQVLISQLGYSGFVNLASSSVFWLEASATCNGCWDLLKKNLATGTTSIAQTFDHGFDPVVTQRTLAWQEVDSQGKRILIKDLQTGEIRTVVTMPLDTLGVSLQLSDEYLVWGDAKYGLPDGSVRYNLWSYSLKAREIRKASEGTTAPDYELHFAISGHNLIWTNPWPYRTNLDNGDTVQLFDKPAYKLFIRGDTFAWVNDFRIWAMKLSKQIPVQVDADPVAAAGLTIAGEWLVWDNEVSDFKPGVKRLGEVFPGVGLSP